MGVLGEARQGEMWRSEAAAVVPSHSFTKQRLVWVYHYFILNDSGRGLFGFCSPHCGCSVVVLYCGDLHTFLLSV